MQVMDAARHGDDAAKQVMRWAGEELGWLAVAVARQIGMDDDPVEIIESGSVFAAGDLIRLPMQEIVLQQCPQAKFIRLDCLPVVGAVILAMENAGFNGYVVRDKIIRTLKNIMT
jgi:hypothetical protein